MACRSISILASALLCFLSALMRATAPRNAVDLVVDMLKSLKSVRSSNSREASSLTSKLVDELNGQCKHAYRVPYTPRPALIVGSIGTPTTPVPRKRGRQTGFHSR
jgi:hypothetical protein